MKSYGYILKNGVPLLILAFDNEQLALDARQKLSSIFNKIVGSINKQDPRKLICGGHVAIKAAKLYSVDLPQFDEWKPKAGGFCSIISDQEIIDEAKKYKTRSGWKRGNLRHYQETLKRRRHIIAACTAHMERPVGPYSEDGHQAYVYEFADKSAYVGITCNWNRRHESHLETGPVARKIAQGVSYTLKRLETKLSPDEACKKEDEYTLKYVADGWVNLSTAKWRGALGSLTKYTYGKIIETARKYASKKEFSTAHGPMVQFVYIKGWMPKISAELGWPKHADHWTKEECVESARKHRWLVDWLNADACAYQSARVNGWLADIKAQFFPKHKPSVASKWTPDACINRAQDFETLTKWQYNAGDASYQTARRKGWLPAIRLEVFGI